MKWAVTVQIVTCQVPGTITKKKNSSGKMLSDEFLKSFSVGANQSQVTFKEKSSILARLLTFCTGLFCLFIIAEICIYKIYDDLKITLCT